MGFDDRHAETLSFILVAAVVAPLAIMLLSKVGFSGWGLVFSSLACVVGVLLVIVLIVNCVDIYDRFREKKPGRQKLGMAVAILCKDFYDWLRKQATGRQKLGVAVTILGPLTVVGYQVMTWWEAGGWPPVSLHLLLQMWAPVLLGGYHDHAWYDPYYSIERVWLWFMDLPLSVTLCVVGFFFIIWDDLPPREE